MVVFSTAVRLIFQRENLYPDIYKAPRRPIGSLSTAVTGDEILTLRGAGPQDDGFGDLDYRDSSDIETTSVVLRRKAPRPKPALSEA